MEVYESELGDVKLTEEYFERQRSDSDEWRWLEDENLVDKLHYSKIEELRVQPEAEKPYVSVKTGGEWRRLYFCPEEDVKEFFDRLEYLWNSFRQRS